MKTPVIFSDLDETLLDRKTYSFEQALPALKMIAERRIPLVLCSSKTRAEMEVYRERLQNDHPFIVENGGGIVVPEGYFADLGGHEASREDGYDVIALGVRYPKLREALAALREEGFKLRGFGDMSAEEISGLTRLSPEEAALSKQRQFDEAFIYNGDMEELKRAAQGKGLDVIEGRLLHLLGGSDKGKAVDILKELYLKKLGEAVFMALGDSPTDEPMLKRVDYPVLVQKDDCGYDARVSAENLIKAQGVGPAGWNNAVMSLIQKIASEG